MDGAEQIKKVRRIRIEWGVEQYPVGADWSGPSEKKRNVRNSIGIMVFFGENSTYIPNSTEVDDSGNCFLYVNGIMSNTDVVKLNQKELEALIHSPVNIIHNVTDSLVMDLIECVIGKETEDLTEASTNISGSIKLLVALPMTIVFSFNITPSFINPVALSNLL